MNLYRLLAARAEAENPIRVGVIGAGKFGSMFLSQAYRTAGMQVMAVADLDVERAKAALVSVHWPAERYAARSFEEAHASGGCHVTDDSMAMIAAPGLDVVVDATGSPSAGIRHALEAFKHGRHMVMVNVEADVLAGPLLARKAREAGVVYSLAYGDQPALIAEQVDWARAIGLEVVAAGKGTRYQPRFHQSTPATVWEHYGLSAAEAQSGNLNPQMFNSFLDGTKSGIEMAAVANACGLNPPKNGLAFPAVGFNQFAQKLIPAEDGGLLEGRGMVEVVASEDRDGKPLPDDLRAGDELDGEGGYTVWGKLMPAADSLKIGGLPIGLAHGVRLKRDVAQGELISWDDVTFDATDPTVRFRREMEQAFSAS